MNLYETHINILKYKAYCIIKGIMIICTNYLSHTTDYMVKFVDVLFSKIKIKL